MNGDQEDPRGFASVNDPKEWLAANYGGDLEDLIGDYMACVDERDAARSESLALRAERDEALIKIEQLRGLYSEASQLYEQARREALGLDAEIDAMRTRLVEEHEGHSAYEDARLWEKQCAAAEDERNILRDENERLAAALASARGAALQQALDLAEQYMNPALGETYNVAVERIVEDIRALAARTAG